MPDHRTHRIFERMILGKEFPDVDKTMDALAELGPRHRDLPPHDPMSLMMFANDPEKLRAAYLHYIVDKFDSEMNKQFNKALKRRGNITF